MIELPQIILKMKMKKRYLDYQKQTCIIRSSDEAVVGRKVATPNVSLACRLFWAENDPGPEVSGRNTDLPLSCLNQSLDGGPVTGMEYSLEMSAKNTGQGWVGELLEI